MQRFKKLLRWFGVAVVLLPLMCICNPIGGFTALQSPSWHHLLGTDSLGRDNLSVLLVSWHYSVLIGVAAATVAVLVSTLLSFLTLNGWGKDFIHGFIDTFMSIPRMFVLLLLGVVLPPNSFVVALLIALLSIPPSLKVIASAVSTVSYMPFMESAKAVGVRGVRLYINYYLKPILPTIISQWSVSVGWAVYADGGMSFLGVGDISRPGLGTMIRQAVSVPGAMFTGMFWWYVFPPVFLLALTSGVLILLSHIHISSHNNRNL